MSKESIAPVFNPATNMTLGAELAAVTEERKALERQYAEAELSTALDIAALDREILGYAAKHNLTVPAALGIGAQEAKEAKKAKKAALHEKNAQKKADRKTARDLRVASKGKTSESEPVRSVRPARKEINISLDFTPMVEATASREGLRLNTMTSAPDLPRGQKERKEQEVTPHEAVKALTSAMPLENPFATQNDYEDFRNNFVKDHAKDGLVNILAEIEKSIPEFKDMGPGARMLTIQAFNDKLFAEVSVSGKRGFERKMNDMSDLGPLSRIRDGATKLEKMKYKAAQAIGAGINGLRHGLRKNYIIKDAEQKALRFFTQDNIAGFVRENAGLARTIAETNLDARLDADGRTVYIDYARESEMGPGRQKEIASEYNRAATKLSRIPEAWNKSDATPSEKRAYRQALAYFKEKELSMREVYEERAGGDEVMAANYTGKARYQMEAMRFFSQNPDATDALRKIATSGEGTKIARSIAAFWKDKTSLTNLKYMVTGAGIRAGLGMAAYAVTGTALAGTAYISIPIAAAVAGTMGYFRGKDKALAQFRDERRAAVTGDKIAPERMAVMSRADLKTHQLDRITGELYEAMRGGSFKEVAKLRNQLETHVKFVEEKKKRGEINYAAGVKDTAGQNYHLMMALHAAYVSMDIIDDRFGGIERFEEVVREDKHVYSDDPAEFEHSDFRRRGMLSSLTEATEARVAAARKAEIKRQAIEGLRIGAAFGSFGAAIMSWYHAGHDSVPSSARTHAGVTTHEPSLHSTSRIDQELDEKIAQAKASPAAPVAPDVPAAPGALGAGANVEFSSKGIEQTILNFRHSPGFKDLTPDQRAAFEGRVGSIAKELKGFRPDAGDGKESISFPKGSEFGVSKDGKILVLEPGGKVTVLGHIEGTAIKADASEADLRYIDTDARSLERGSVHIDKNGKLVEHAPRATPEELGLRSQPHEDLSGSTVDSSGSYVEGASPESYEEITPEMQRVNVEIDEDLKDIDPAYVSYVDRTEYAPEPATMGELARVERISNRLVRHQINRFFSYRELGTGRPVLGQHSLVWRSYAHRPAISILRDDIRLPMPAFRPFLRHLHALAEKYPDVRRDQPLERFMREAYSHKAQERVLGRVLAK